MSILLFHEGPSKPITIKKIQKNHISLKIRLIQKINSLYFLQH